MLRIVCVTGEHQDQHSAVANTSHDTFGPIGSRFDVAGSDPAFDPSRLKVVTNRFRGPVISIGMADEDHVRHVSSPSHSLSPFVCQSPSHNIRDPPLLTLLHL